MWTMLAAAAEMSEIPLGCSRNVWSATPPVHSACYQTEVASTDSDTDQRDMQMKHLALTLKLLIVWVYIWSSYSSL